MSSAATSSLQACRPLHCRLSVTHCHPIRPSRAVVVKATSYLDTRPLPATDVNTTRPVAAATTYSVPEAERFDLPHTTRALHLLPEGPWNEVNGGVCAPAGFSAQGLHAGLRQPNHRADVALLASAHPAVTAGCLSGSALSGMSVEHSRAALLEQQTARAVLMHQGQAAAGQQSQRDAQHLCQEVGAALGIDPATVLLQSAGDSSDGQHPRLRLDCLLPAVPALGSQLESSAEAAYHAACAMTTADTTTKEAALEVCLGEEGMVRLGGMASATPSGIQAVITCDAAVSSEVWRGMFDRAAAASFEQVALCCSPNCINESVLGLANGAAHHHRTIRDASSAAAQRLEAALTALMQCLAKAVAWDGEDAHCLIEVEVSGADTPTAAREAALAVARSGPVRAAINERRPEWASIAAALGASGVPFLPGELLVAVGGMPLVHHGKVTADIASASAYCSEYLRTATAQHSQVAIKVKIGHGRETAKAWTYDAC